MDGKKKEYEGEMERCADLAAALDETDNARLDQISSSLSLSRSVSPFLTFLRKFPSGHAQLLALVQRIQMLSRVAFKVAAALNCPQTRSVELSNTKLKARRIASFSSLLRKRRRRSVEGKKKRAKDSCCLFARTRHNAADQERQF